ncbi:MAG: AAA family ATPase [Gallionellaceae bacterium]
MNDQAEYQNQQALVAALIKNLPFPHAVKAVRLVETHISWVLLAGHYAYKIKKAVNLGFLDFTGVEVRRRYCEEEIRLNRRLAPRIYLEVTPIGGSPDRPEFGMQPAIEYAVRMRRFASTRLLDHLLARGKLPTEVMERLAATLAAFHGRIPQADLDTEFGTPAIILDAAVQNFDQLQSLLTAQADCASVAALRKISQSEFAACNLLFEQRRKVGFVRECHGDLHLGNVVLIGAEPIPFDGIEFDPGLRWIDVMNEVAFMVMDLLYRRRPDLAYRFLNGWLEATGDYGGVSVLRFYLAYRAVVRAKVKAIRAFQTRQVDTKALAACRGYLALAQECFVRRPALIITHGLPGSGKSTFALAAAERLQAIRIRSDVERKRLYGMDALHKSHSGADAGIYSADATRRTYARLLELARGLLDAGFPVVVDAAFLRQDEREKFHGLALDRQVPFAIASMQASDTVLHARIKKRQIAARDASEADINVMHRLKEGRQPLSRHELASTVKMQNDSEGMIADARSWEKLDKLLAGQGG